MKTKMILPIQFAFLDFVRKELHDELDYEERRMIQVAYSIPNSYEVDSDFAIVLNEIRDKFLSNWVNRK